MKVALVSTWQVPCGIATYTAGLMDGLESAGIACEVIPIRRNTLNYLPFRELRIAFRKLASEVPADADVIHLQHDFGFFAGAYPTHYSSLVFNTFMQALRKHRKPIFVTLHSLPIFLRPPLAGLRAKWHFFRLNRNWQSNVIRHFHPKTRTFAIVHSRQTRRLYVDTGLDARATRVILHHTPAFAPNTLTREQVAARKVELGFKPDAVVLSMFGFISRYKGCEHAIDALRLLPENHMLVIVGGPHPDGRDKTMDSLIHQVIQHDLQDRVRITGFVEKSVVREYQAIADINLAPYLGDTNLSSSGALTWALASGKPTIASKIDAFRELYEISPCVLLCTPDAPAELAFQIDRLQMDTALQTALVQHAREYCAQTSREETAAQHIAAYEDMLAGSALKSVPARDQLMPAKG